MGSSTVLTGVLLGGCCEVLLLLSVCLSAMADLFLCWTLAFSSTLALTRRSALLSPNSSLWIDVLFGPVRIVLWAGRWTDREAVHVLDRKDIVESGK